MSRRTKLSQTEITAVVGNLIDLRVPVNTVAHIMGQTPANVYNHLRKSGRLNGHGLKPLPLAGIYYETMPFLKKLFGNAEVLLPALKEAATA